MHNNARFHILIGSRSSLTNQTLPQVVFWQVSLFFDYHSLHYIIIVNVVVITVVVIVVINFVILFIIIVINYFVIVFIIVVINFVTVFIIVVIVVAKQSHNACVNYANRNASKVSYCVNLFFWPLEKTCVYYSKQPLSGSEEF